ncbi:L-cystine transport system permease protein TcyL [Sporomusa silvacetica DSM 10669]|uniref:L-cystine transport system permease protein TcyL n=1 Tax=Sporomusa silvacetica DSM 10669 TaxID=1123289 RepID=A0ABZ3II75_9FIRM|nr:amino acid ABC transporter permease [Sporomusa silvacetica]OZC14904.1 L-cystine transport system permease protein TcyL [Sporomusa silvacetica DSM 10669]
MENIFLFSLFIDSFPQLLSRLHITLYIVVVALLFGLLLGTGIAVARLHKVPVLSQLAAAYVSFIRGIPILVLLFIVYIGVPLAAGAFGANINRWDTLIFVMITYIVNSAAFLSEIVRSAVAGVEKGQMEAALSVGMTRWQDFSRIIAPQAIQIAIPALGNTVVSLLKDTSLAYTLGIIDVIGIIQAISSSTHRSLEAYTAAACIFFVLSFILEQFFKWLEKKIGINNSIPGAKVAPNNKIAVVGR